MSLTLSSSFSLLIDDDNNDDTEDDEDEDEDEDYDDENWDDYPFSILSDLA